MQDGNFSRDALNSIATGRAHCALCREAIRPDEDALMTPDFLADDADPFWRFADAAMHRACFLVWDRRKAFVARFNRLARGWVAPDGSYPRMTSEGDVVTACRASAEQQTALESGAHETSIERCGVDRAGGVRRLCHFPGRRPGRK